MPDSQNNHRFLLLQVRNPDDPMCSQEVRCFARALGCSVDQIRPFDLLHHFPSLDELDQGDMILIGGSGHYGAVQDAPWLDRALEGLRQLHSLSKPMFASCWGFQAMSRALGGTVRKDVGHAELGTHKLFLTPEGERDPLFGPLGHTFYGQMGHEDRVVQLPADVVLLASTPLVEYQAYRLGDKPMYCTQFHPELNRENLVRRVEAYPEYVESVSGMTMDSFVSSCRDTPETETLLKRFIDLFLAE